MKYVNTNFWPQAAILGGVSTKFEYFRLIWHDFRLWHADCYIDDATARGLTQIPKLPTNPIPSRLLVHLWLGRDTPARFGPRAVAKTSCLTNRSPPNRPSQAPGTRHLLLPPPKQLASPPSILPISAPPGYGEGGGSHPAAHVISGPDFQPLMRINPEKQFSSNWFEGRKRTGGARIFSIVWHLLLFQVEDAEKGCLLPGLDATIPPSSELPRLVSVSAIRVRARLADSPFLLAASLRCASTPHANRR